MGLVAVSQVFSSFVVAGFRGVVMVWLCWW